jgi:hypothetical protein
MSRSPKALVSFERCVASGGTASRVFSGVRTAPEGGRSSLSLALALDLVGRVFLQDSERLPLILSDRLIMRGLDPDGGGRAESRGAAGEAGENGD